MRDNTRRTSTLLVWRRDNTVVFAATETEVAAAALLVLIFVFESMTNPWDGLASRIHITSMAGGWLLLTAFGFQPNDQTWTVMGARLCPSDSTHFF